MAAAADHVFPRRPYVHLLEHNGIRFGDIRCSSQQLIDFSKMIYVFSQEASIKSLEGEVETILFGKLYEIVITNNQMDVTIHIFNRNIAQLVLKETQPTCSRFQFFVSDAQP